MSFDDLLNRLEDAERRFVGTLFLAPLAGKNQVRVRIAGVICLVTVEENLPQDCPYTGWAVLQAISTNRARFVRPARLQETQDYLALFPRIRLVLVHRNPIPPVDSWLAAPAHRGDQPIQISGLAPVRLVEDGLQRFETIVARFDGQEFWYERRDPRRDPALAVYLRQQLDNWQGGEQLPLAPEALRKRGLSAGERQAYGMVRSWVVLSARAREETRLAEALAHAGGELTNFIEREAVFVVHYQVDGKSYSSTIRKDTLSVLSAGVCLSGEDERFDLTSLVGVLREGDRQDHLIRIGNEGMDEENYRRIYPGA